MTTTPTLQELVESWRGSDIEMSATMFAESLERTLQAHPVVPLDELKLAVRDGTVFALIDKYEPRPSNPHPRGTYLWAREENQRERTVFRRCDPALTRIAGTTFWMDLRFKHDDFTATDWEVVT